MRYFYDYEFIERPGSLQPISIGVVAEDGREYYAVYDDFDRYEVLEDEWLMDNVMASIKHTIVRNGIGHDIGMVIEDTHLKSRNQIAIDLSHFIDKDADLWAWYGAYDHVCLAMTFGRMIDLPKNVPMYTNDLKTLVRLAGNPQMPRQPEGLHNALEDAKWNLVRYQYVTNLLREQRLLDEDFTGRL